MTAWWYWALVVLAALLLLAPYLADRWEARADRRDRETWERMWR